MLDTWTLKDNPGDAEQFGNVAANFARECAKHDRHVWFIGNPVTGEAIAILSIIDGYPHVVGINE